MILHRFWFNFMSACVYPSVRAFMRHVLTPMPKSLHLLESTANKIAIHSCLFVSIISFHFSIMFCWRNEQKIKLLEKFLMKNRRFIAAVVAADNFVVVVVVAVSQNLSWHWTWTKVKSLYTQRISLKIIFKVFEVVCAALYQHYIETRAKMRSINGED